jgi:N-methylhydantoinase B
MTTHLGGSPSTTESRVFDPIAMEVFSNRLLSITEDMNNTVIRSSFSTNIKERRDCSVGLFDGRGRLVAQGAHNPLQLGSLLGGVTSLLETHSIEDMVEGDAFVMNDPYLAGGTHMPDISVVTPMFWDEQVRFFTVNIGHHSDVGGAVPGSISRTFRNIFQEGLRIPPIRIARAGVIDEDLVRMISHNSREPEDRDLDLRVQVAANQRGGAAVREVIERMGIEAVGRAIDDLLHYTNRRLAQRVADLPDGESSFTRYLDHDGLGGEPVPIRVAIRVAGERLSFDFTGSGAEARGAMNVPRSALHSTVYYAVKAMLDPELPPNGGMFEGIEIYAPEGTIVNPRSPAAVGARSITCNRVAGAIFGAFGGFLPKERAMACCHDLIPATVYSGNRHDRPGMYVYLETMGGGAGARFDRDGMDGIHVHMSNTSNLPAEALEHEYQLLVDEYALVEDSGGAGRHRGGLGLARQIRATEDGAIFSVRSDGHVIGAPGIFGGQEGGTARLLRNFGQPDEEIMSSAIANLELKKGDSMRLETPGGGGYGPPDQRPLHLLAADLRGGRISRIRAEKDYGRERVCAALGEVAELA